MLIFVKNGFMKETKYRSMVKCISWRVLASLTTAVLILIFTGNWMLSIGIGSFEVVSKIVLYFFHERIWDKISWGREIKKKV